MRKKGASRKRCTGSNTLAKTNSMCRCFCDRPVRLRCTQCSHFGFVHTATFHSKHSKSSTLSVMRLNKHVHSYVFERYISLKHIPLIKIRPGLMHRLLKTLRLFRTYCMICASLLLFQSARSGILFLVLGTRQQLML